MTLINEVVTADGIRTLMIKRSDLSTENGFFIYNFQIEEACCNVCQEKVRIHDAVKGTSCSSSGRKNVVMHKACRPTGQEGDDKCVLCDDDNCQVVDITCRTGYVCQRRNCRNNVAIFYSIFIHKYDSNGCRIFGAGCVEADAFLTCAKCVIYEVSVEMEQLLLGVDISTPLQLLFGGYHQIIRDAFNCSPCYLTCLL